MASNGGFFYARFTIRLMRGRQFQKKTSGGRYLNNSVHRRCAETGNDKIKQCLEGTTLDNDWAR